MGVRTNQESNVIDLIAIPDCLNLDSALSYKLIGQKFDIQNQNLISRRLRMSEMDLVLLSQKQPFFPTGFFMQRITESFLLLKQYGHRQTSDEGIAVCSSFVLTSILDLRKVNRCEPPFKLCNFCSTQCRNS